MAVTCVVVIPTRNRPNLAKNAIRSVLRQSDRRVSVLVSDNSTVPHHADDLASFCARLRHPRLRYLRPHQPLPMPHHWEFAVSQAETDSHATHFAILTDRMVFRDGMLAAVLQHVASRPDAVVSYNDDMVHDRTLPVRLERKSLTGQVLDLDAGHLLYLSSVGVFPQALPRMLNCVVPRELLGRIRTRFGDAYTSVAPDLCHAYRCLAVVDRIRYFDAPVMAQYGFAQSNGSGYYGESTNDAWSDFQRNAEPAGLTSEAPIPDVCCNLNVVYHEYCFVRSQAVDDSKFPAVHWIRYVHAIAHDIHLCGNPDVRAQLFRILRRHAGDDLAGWIPPAAPASPQRPGADNGRKVDRFWRGRWPLAGFVRLALIRLGIQPPQDALSAFDDAATALAFSNSVRPKYVPQADHVGYLQTGWKVAL